jgi:hypothetical protein
LWDGIIPTLGHILLVVANKRLDLERSDNHVVKIRKRLIQIAKGGRDQSMNRKFLLSFAEGIVASLFVTLNPLDAQTAQTGSGVAVPRNDAMELNQEKTTHHFKLLPNGGTIEITADDPSDATTRDAIRKHVAKIAAMFAEGNFSIPTFVHGQKPPGVDSMTRLKSTISYAAESLPNGGGVRITTANSAALAAVHDFLRFQIQEHKTGDSLAEPVPAKRKHPANNLGHDARPAPP